MQSDPNLERIRNIFEDFFNQENYWEYPLESLNNKNVMKNISLHRGNKSYTINKKKVYICMKNEEGEYYNDNMIIYVLAHELAHVMCNEIGHTKKFHHIFESLLVKLANAGIYNPSIPIQQNYCKNGDPQV